MVFTTFSYTSSRTEPVCTRHKKGGFVEKVFTVDIDSIPILNVKNFNSECIKINGK